MVLEDDLHVGFAMHHEDLLERRGVHRLKPVGRLAIVGVRAERVDLCDLGADRVPFAHDLYLELAVLEPAPAELYPPTTKTVPSLRSVAVWLDLPVFKFVVVVQVSLL